MAEEETESTTETEQETAPVVDTEAPQWAKDLKRTIEELPGKLRASVSDDDKRSIAESVHGLFESSGAFRNDEEVQHREEQETTVDTEDAKPPAATQEAPPQKGKGIRRIAALFDDTGS